MKIIKKDVISILYYFDCDSHCDCDCDCDCNCNCNCDCNCDCDCMLLNNQYNIVSQCTAFSIVVYSSDS